MVACQKLKKELRMWLVLMSALRLILGSMHQGFLELFISFVEFGGKVCNSYFSFLVKSQDQIVTVGGFIAEKALRHPPDSFLGHLPWGVCCSESGGFSGKASLQFCFGYLLTSDCGYSVT